MSKKVKLSEVGFWADCEPEYIEVLAKIDATNDPRLLLPYLNVPDGAKRHFADLFERKQFTARKGQKGRVVRRDPSYLISKNLVLLMYAMGAPGDRQGVEGCESSAMKE
jgi:hypothetical protein